MPFEFKALEIPGPKLVFSKNFPDPRGVFAETYKEPDFHAAGLKDRFIQDNISRSVKGVIRGLHFQKSAYAQAKLVCCLAGRVLDVAVDIRRGSPHYGKWVSRVLDGASWDMLYVPEGFAHGFAVLSDSALVSYKVSGPYAPEHSRGICWNDPALGIDWQVGTPVLSGPDAKWPPLSSCDNDFSF